ncbi:transcription initiation factor TFIID subunit 9-like [Impatiens glandulifera]|uniref:transcription initiation factor TFIID subunit 9-like n=1 Tax=Impatiens glandulifera TaxID=253017 RepID=UPI001FB076D6|nr:transcription initiation factor TFIID subunit 9-like [Impatiens glandulifera]
MADRDEDIPRDAKIVKALLKSMGVEDYEPRVVQQFLELWYRYVVDVLSDSQVYSEHAGKVAIDSDDIKLAIQSKVNFSFSQPPPREDLLELARNRNKIPLPKIVPGPGIPLPNEQDTLINPNYQLAITRKLAEQALEETEEDEDEEMADPDPEPNPEPNPNSTKEHHDTEMPQSRTTPLRVSFPLGDKRPR